MTNLALIPGDGDSVDDRVRAVIRVMLAARDEKPTDLSEPLGLSKHQIWDRMRGDKPFSVVEVVRLADYFEIDPGVFLTGPDVLIAAVAGSADDDDLAPGSIKNRRRLPGVSRDVAGARLSLVAA